MDVLSAGWRDELSETRALGQAWLETRESLALRVPSVILAGEHNLLVNPNHAEMQKVKTLRSEPFVFDPRLWKERQR